MKLSLHAITVERSHNSLAPKRVSFSFLLPLGDLVLWGVLVGIPSVLTYINLEQDTAEGVGSTRFDESAVMALPIGNVLSFFVHSVTEPTGQTILALNTPGFLGEIVASLPTSWPSSWRPQEFLLKPWRCITFPLYCLPSWWFIGSGLDALLRLHQLYWSALLWGPILCAGFVVLFVGLKFGVPASDRDDPITAWILRGTAL